MTFDPSDPRDPPRVPAADDTAAFQRFYLAEGERPWGQPEAAPEAPSLLYRIFVGWWRDR